MPCARITEDVLFSGLVVVIVHIVNVHHSLCIYVRACVGTHVHVHVCWP